MEEMRAILDSLMGSDRNSLTEKPIRASFKDRDVCHFYLIDFCPHDLFPNTKSDLGPCPNKHSDSLKELFLADSEHEYYRKRYEREFLDALHKLVEGVEQRIKKGNERILGPDESTLQHDKLKKSELMKAEVAVLSKRAQEAGEKGNIAEAETYSRKMTEIRCDLDRLNSSTSDVLSSLSAQEKSLRVCPVCGAMQSLGDATSRFESHVSGKQHVGHERIRNTFAALKAKIATENARLVEARKSASEIASSNAAAATASIPGVVKDDDGVLNGQRSDPGDHRASLSHRASSATAPKRDEEMNSTANRKKLHQDRYSPSRSRSTRRRSRRNNSDENRWREKRHYQRDTERRRHSRRSSSPHHKRHASESRNWRHSRKSEYNRSRRRYSSRSDDGGDSANNASSTKHSTDKKSIKSHHSKHDD